MREARFGRMAKARSSGEEGLAHRTDSASRSTVCLNDDLARDLRSCIDGALKISLLE